MDVHDILLLSCRSQWVIFFLYLFVFEGGPQDHTGTRRKLYDFNLFQHTLKQSMV